MYFQDGSSRQAVGNLLTRSVELIAYTGTSTGILVMLQKTTLWALSGITFLVVAMYIAFQISQWPSVLYHRHYGRVRHIIDHGWFGLQRTLERYAVTARLNERFDTNDPDAVLDVTILPRSRTPTGSCRRSSGCTGAVLHQAARTGSPTT